MISLNGSSFAHSFGLKHHGTVSGSARDHGDKRKPLAGFFRVEWFKSTRPDYHSFNINCNSASIRCALSNPAVCPQEELLRIFQVLQSRTFKLHLYFRGARVRVALRAASERPRRPFVRAARWEAFEREARNRRRAAAVFAKLCAPRGTRTFALERPFTGFRAALRRV
jgi:hypothetical protein